MKTRIVAHQVAPEAFKLMLGLETYVRNCGLDPSLLHLVKIRASQINSCSYCVHMHTREARAAGETEERIYLLSAWHESPLFTARERAALAWTEAVTLVADTHVPDDVYEAAIAQFSDAELVNLTTAIATINAWNRMAISFRTIHPTQPARAA